MDGLDVDRFRLAWWAVGAVLGLVVLAVVVSFVGTFVFAVFIYYATRPVYRRVGRRVGPASLAAGLSLLLLALPAVLLLGYALAIGLQELGRFANMADLGTLETATQPYLNASAVVEDPAAILSDPSLLRVARESSSAALNYLGFIGTGLLHVFVMFALAFYMLRDGSKLTRWFLHRFDDDRGVLASYLRAVDRDFHRIFSGNILNALATGAIGAIVYSLLNFFAPAGHGIPYPALVGLLAGAASLIPVVGMKLVYVPVAAYMLVVELTSADPLYWVLGAFVALSFVVVDAIPDFVLRPYVSGRNLHVGLVMFAYILGPLLFGWYGIFLGPILLVLVIHFARLVLPELVDGERIRPFSVDPSHFTDPPPEPPAPPPEPAGDEPAPED